MKRPAIFVGYDVRPDIVYSGQETYIDADAQILDGWGLTGKYYPVKLSKLPTLEEAVLIAKTIESDQMQPVYFFSRHEPSNLMVEHLGGTITQQFHGTVANIRRVGDALTFEETIGQETIAHQIPTNSVVVAVAPITLQLAWLQAGISKLLIPQTRREADGKGGATFTYTGLRWIRSIVVESEQFAGEDPFALEGKSQARSSFVQSAASP